MKPLMMMFEATNGRVSTMYQMNNVIRQSLGSLRKAIYDNNLSSLSSYERDAEVLCITAPCLQLKLALT